MQTTADVDPVAAVPVAAVLVAVIFASVDVVLTATVLAVVVLAAVVLAIDKASLAPLFLRSPLTHPPLSWMIVSQPLFV